MSIPISTLVSTVSGPMRADELLRGASFVGYSWVEGAPISRYMTLRDNGATGTLVEVETWFAGGCRDCNHHKNVGLKFLVAPGTAFLLKSGDYLEAESLQNGHRLRVLGRDCGYEEVKSVRSIELEANVLTYSVIDSPNFALGAAELPNKVLVRS